jgi:hypothetical protein
MRASSAPRNAKRKSATTKRALLGSAIKSRYFFLIAIRRHLTMSKDVLQFVSSEFDVFTRKPIQHAVQATDVVIYKPIAPIEQSDLEFLIPTDFDKYVDPI